MKKIFADNLRASFILAVVAIICIFFNLLPAGVVFGVLGFIKAEKAIEKRRYLVILSAILNLIPVLCLFIPLFYPSVYSYNFVFLAVSLVAKIVTFVGLWKGLPYVLNYPDSQNPDNRFRIIRAVVLIVFSAIIIQICVTLGYELRYIVGSAYIREDVLAMVIVDGMGGWYGNAMLVLGFTPSFLLIYLVSRVLRFSKFYSRALSVIIPVLWLIIWLGGISVPGDI